MNGLCIDKLAHDLELKLSQLLDSCDDIYYHADNSNLHTGISTISIAFTNPKAARFTNCKAVDWLEINLLNNVMFADEDTRAFLRTITSNVCRGRTLKEAFESLALTFSDLLNYSYNYSYTFNT